VLLSAIIGPIIIGGTWSAPRAIWAASDDSPNENHDIDIGNVAERDNGAC